ncbi:M14 family zinc carboxypeptidase [Nocardioides donggukensis]|uniref:Carboxypeptidase n=1 Tax=Nocardioides donggukensis TaxID=2774019 RepID=A0A927K4P3_9ACTN|nr:M14 family zinc carboxypeptidase [Nocardioides donggukensis]MBD8870184.1 carboxypeptidase [Nocardioides donggukensis]
MRHHSRRFRLLAASATTALVLAGLAPTLAGGSAQAQDGTFAPRLVTVDTPTRADKELLQTLGLDLTEHAGHDYVEVVLHTGADLSRLVDAGLDYDVRIPDLTLRAAQNNKVNEEYAAATLESPLPSGRDEYRTLADYNDDIRELAAIRPGIAKRIELPHRSLDGRTVYGVEIGRDVQKAEDGRPTFALFGVHHAREWPSGELAMEFAYDLVKNYGSDDRITGLLDRARVVVVPVVNVDGFELSRTDGGVIDLREADGGGTATILGTPGNAYKRKNCRIVDGQDTPDGTCRAGSATSPGGFGTGVDLNRNYGGFWGGPGASDMFADPTYRGPAPFSEPEIQNVRELVSSRQVTTLISNHTFSNLVLRPNGVHPDTIGPDGLPVGNAPDEEGLKALGAKMTAANGYRNIHGWELYDTTGTTEDWSYNATGGYGYTFEIGADEFHPPFPQVVEEYLGSGEYAGKGNREAYLAALENTVDTATHAVIKGKAPAGATLRLRKQFSTPTWESSFTDTLDTTMKVGSRGSYQWHVNQSTRPVVMDKLVQITEDEPVRTETIQGGPTTIGQSVDHPFSVTESGIDVLQVDLDWPTPDDMDLEVYRKNADGSLTQVGSSGNFVNEKERAEIAAPAPGDYVLRVINFASTAPTYTLTATLFDSTLVDSEEVPGLIENWTMTCEVDGKVRQRESVVVDRGQRVRVDLSECGRRR